MIDPITRAAALTLYAHGLDKLADRPGLDEGWLRGLAINLRETVHELRRLAELEEKLEQSSS